MRNNPVTTEYFEEELLPLFEDCMYLLMDSDPESSLVQWTFEPKTRVVTMHVQAPREDAARVIGREHRMRNSLYTLFSGICRNHGFNLAVLSVDGRE